MIETALITHWGWDRAEGYEMNQTWSLASESLNAKRREETYYSKKQYSISTQKMQKKS